MNSNDFQTDLNGITGTVTKKQLVTLYILQDNVVIDADFIANHLVPYFDYTGSCSRGNITTKTFKIGQLFN